MTRSIAVIGTAGRDPMQPMTKEFWLRILAHARSVLKPEDNVHTGGAAWIDHVPVALFLEGFFTTGTLSLWLPCPLEEGYFIGPEKSAASALNFYHDKFSRILCEDSRNQILEAQEAGAKIYAEPATSGYGGFFARNQKVAAKATDGCYAYTWGEGDVPMDGGTSYTWERIPKEGRVHVSLKGLV